MMNKGIRSMIDAIFAEMKMTAENLALRDELMANAQARFEDAIAQGKTEEDAFAEVAGSLEDVGDLLREMNEGNRAEQSEEANEPQRCFADDLGGKAARGAAGEHAQENDRTPDGAPQTDLGDALNKAFTALGSLGQSIMPQAKKFARQMDDATGGMLSDLGRAVNKGMQDAQKAAGDVLDKYLREEPAAQGSDEKTPGDLREEAKDLYAQAELKRAVGDHDGAQALEDQAELMQTQADALEQVIAMEQADRPEESQTCEQPEEIHSDRPIYGADGELNEEAFAQSVEEMSREAEEIIRNADETSGCAAKQAGDRGVEELHGRRNPQESEIRFPVAGLRRIDVKLDADDIAIAPADGNEIIVRWSAMSDDNEPEVSLHHHTLTIRRKNPDVFKTFFSVFSKNGGQITVFIPRGYGADYTLSTTSGNIRLNGLDVEGVRVSTTSGGIRIEPDLTVRAGKIKAETVSGSVTVSAVAQTVEADSISGEVFISCDAASVKGDVVSGKLHIEGACDNWDVDAVSGSAELICTTVPAGKIKIDTISGGAKLYLPESIRGFAVEFDSMGGSLRNEFGPDRFGTCTLPIKMDTISGKMLIAPLQA